MGQEVPSSGAVLWPERISLFSGLPRTSRLSSSVPEVGWGRGNKVVLSLRAYISLTLVLREQGTEEIELPVKNCPLDGHVQNSSGEPSL